MAVSLRGAAAPRSVLHWVVPANPKLPLPGEAASPACAPAVANQLI
ncbi:hypothetical protein [uncultured Mobiluncus sp.]|nr:hypothetical protein [uncultured Mobiluncus sp.]